MKRHYSLSAFFVVLLLAFFCYSAAFDADFQLDDASNLGGLAAVNDLDSAYGFIVSGKSGPSGRPLALATFALQADEWENGARAFLTVNVLIHLLNALLLMWVVREIALARHENAADALAIGCITAALWVLLPLLATSSLLVIQRMATLSATVQLLGLASYLVARTQLLGKPRFAFLSMGLALVGATFVGALAKESALLLPVLVLALELTLLRPPATGYSRSWKLFCGIFLWLPLALLLAYLVSRANYPDALVARRGFDGLDRLLSQTQILWVYLSKALLGLPGNLGIYHPYVPVTRSLLQPLAMISTIAWLAVIVAAIVWRRRAALFSFAVFWFLGAHLIESTVVSLELYFEHRNYLAIFGPVFAIVYFLYSHSAKTRKALLVGAPLVLLINAWFLFSIASLTGDSSAAAKYWAYRYPNSERAVTALVNYQFAEDGIERGLDTISGFTARNPEYAYLRLQELNVACLTGLQGTRNIDLAGLQSQLEKVHFSYLAVQMLSQLATTAAKNVCSDVLAADVPRLGKGLLQNPRYRGDPTFQRMYHQILAGIARQQGDFATTARELATAFTYGATPNLVFMMTMTLIEAGQFDATRQFLDSLRRAAPRNPVRSAHWHHTLDELDVFLAAVEESNEG